MSKPETILKPIMPVIAAAYGFILIYLTSIPLADDDERLGNQVLSWLITLACIFLTLFVVSRIEPKVFPAASQYSLKKPKTAIIFAFLLIAPLWSVVEMYVVYGITSLNHTIQLQPLTCTPDELREDLLASVHAVLLAPLLEELCFRQMGISPFRRLRAKIAVCVVMALLFGILHVRNFPGAFLGAIVYGLVFIWSRNIWYSVALHAGKNLFVTLLSLYSFYGIGELQFSKIPVIFLPDAKVIIASILIAIVGFWMIRGNISSIGQKQRFQ